MTTKTQQVQKEAEDLFLEENFGQVDLSGFPHLQKHVADNADLPDDRFGGLVQESRVSLRKAIPEMAGHDAEMQAELRKRGVEDEPAPHKFYLSTGDEAIVFLGKDNVWRVTVFFEGRQQTIKCASAKSRDDAMTGANRWLNCKRGPTFHELTEEQKLTVSRMCTQGQLESALMTYLLYKCGEVGYDFSTDPRYLPATNEAAFFIFKHSTPDFVDSETVQAYLENYIGDRPVTLPLLRAGFAAYKQEQKKVERGLVLGQIEDRENQAESGPTYEELDELSTEEISRLREQTMRLRAKQVKGGIIQ